jgi:hypothetical protein
VVGAPSAANLRAPARIAGRVTRVGAARSARTNIPRPTRRARGRDLDLPGVRVAERGLGPRVGHCARQLDVGTSRELARCAEGEHRVAVRVEGPHDRLVRWRPALEVSGVHHIPASRWSGSFVTKSRILMSYIRPVMNISPAGRPGSGPRSLFGIADRPPWICGFSIHRSRRRRSRLIGVARLSTDRSSVVQTLVLHLLSPARPGPIGEAPAASWIVLLAQAPRAVRSTAGG